MKFEPGDTMFFKNGNPFKNVAFYIENKHIADNEWAFYNTRDFKNKGFYGFHTDNTDFLKSINYSRIILIEKV